MKLLIMLAIIFMCGCTSLIVGKNCAVSYIEVDGALTKTENSVCEKP